MTYDGQPVRQQISRYTYGEHFDSSKLHYLYMSKNWETGEFTPLPVSYTHLPRGFPSKSSSSPTT